MERLTRPAAGHHAAASTAPHGATAHPADHLRVIAGGATGQDRAREGDALVGTTIDGRYVVERVLGEGGMGLVYRGRHLVLNKPLAIKVLRAEVSRDEAIIGRFRQEAESASSIGNQHIIDISDFGTLPDGSTYFIMELLEGTDLTKLIETAQPLDARRIVHIAKQLCEALAAAHEAGIVHRDLKPDNIYLVRRGADAEFVKVLDFGIAKVGGASSKLTRAGQVFGTPHYMSPEQCSGSGVDHRTDIYAIGTILYEMVVGHTPFDADNLMGILTKHLFEPAVPPATIRPDCPAALEAIIMRCIAKPQDERYASCRDLLGDLIRLEGGLAPLAASRSTAGAPALEAPRATNSAPASVHVASTEPARAPWAGRAFGIAALIALFGAAGAAGALALRHRAATDARSQRDHGHFVTPRVVHDDDTETAAPIASVRVVVDPAGAEVWSGGELLGQSPLEVPRPGAGETLAIELRAPGYETRRLTLSSHTLASELRFALGRERAGSSSRATTSTRSSDHAHDTTPPTMDGATMHVVHEPTEVIDPWATTPR